MLDFAIFAVTFVIILVGAVLYLYPVSQLAKRLLARQRQYPFKMQLVFTCFDSLAEEMCIRAPLKV